jgi:acyl carrier protein
VVSSGVEYAAPRNETERKLAAIWEEVLGRERVGINENFFDAGGHSLKAMKMLAIIHRDFDIKISVENMFSNATVAGMARHIIRRDHLAASADADTAVVSNESFIL